LHQEISALSADEVGACRHLARRLIDEAIHNVLWMIEQSERFDLVASTDEGGSISLREASDGLSVEPNRWFPMFSRFGGVAL
jgi:hypothetical protein